MRKPSEKNPQQPAQMELVLGEMGAQADALGIWQNKKVFVPFGLPREHVVVRSDRTTAQGIVGTIDQILDASPDRVQAPCPHFGICGGCKLQHWSENAYRSWKLDLVRQALAHRGLDLPGDLNAIYIPEKTRRRAELAARKERGQVSLGFHEPASHSIIDLQTCLVLTPTLFAAIAPLRVVLSEALGEGQSIDILATETLTGLDLFVSADFQLSERQRQILAAYATRERIARISWRRGSTVVEPILVNVLPQITFGSVLVDLPVPSFLQPSQAGEEALRAEVLRLAGKSRNIVELYAGCGTFSFELAKSAKVFAVEGSQSSVDALVGAAKRAQLSDRVSAAKRDLDQSPLSWQELKKFDTVVLDPPRTGAKAQAEMIARSALGRVVYVSCNPATFARDARSLVDAGFKLRAVTMVDQFRWSPHVELVALLTRSKPR